MFRFLIIILLISCSHKKDKKTLRKKSAPIKYGPSLEKAEFFDQTNKYGLSNIKSSWITSVDLNDDDYADIVSLPTEYSSPEVYIFNPKLKKFELKENVFPEKMKASFIVFADISGDGVSDAFIAGQDFRNGMSSRPLSLLSGIKKTNNLIHFEKPVILFNDTKPVSTISVVDYDLDGDLDLYVGNWLKRYQKSFLPVEDYFLENINGQLKQKDILTGELELNLAKKMYKNAAPTTASAICDINQDGFPDILSLNSHGYPNKLWMNRYKFRKNFRYFKNFGVESRFSGDSNGHLTQTGGGRSFGVACHDYNRDGIPDVFIGELHHNYDDETKDESSILTGSRFKFPPLFYRTEYALDSFDLSWTQSDKRGLWFDYNNDGLEDLLVDNSGYPPYSRLILFRQHEDHSFENEAKKLGLDIVNPSSSITMDLNKDGKLDIISLQTNQRDSNIKKRIYIFENRVQHLNKSLRIVLKAKKSNKDAHGAYVMVKVRSDNGVHYLNKSYVFSYGQNPQSNEKALFFGLRPDETIEHIKVRWPYAKKANSTAKSMEQIFYHKMRGRFEQLVLKEK